MRVMDGVMAIPGILLAITLVAMWRASLWTVILAITFTEIPRVVRLVRSLVLSIREEPYVEAAVSAGTPALKRLYRHILPNTVAPLIVQGTYICAFAMLVEAILSFLGVGLPPEVPTWGNIMAEGRLQFNEYPHSVLFPGRVSRIHGAVRQHARRWAARHAGPALRQAGRPAMTVPVLQVEGLTVALPRGGDRREAVSGRELRDSAGTTGVSGRRVRIGQVDHRAHGDGPAAPQHPRDRRARFA